MDELVVGENKPTLFSGQLFCFLLGTSESNDVVASADKGMTNGETDETSCTKKRLSW